MSTSVIALREEVVHRALIQFAERNSRSREFSHVQLDVSAALRFRFSFETERAIAAPPR